jgi:hypothetical protein
LLRCCIEPAGSAAESLERRKKKRNSNQPKRESNVTAEYFFGLFGPFSVIYKK